jgi:hypothetical protein
MSAENSPMLSVAIPAFELFMSKWDLLAEKHPRLDRWISVGRFLAEKYYKRMDLTKAYIISMGE